MFSGKTQYFYGHFQVSKLLVYSTRLGTWHHRCNHHPTVPKRRFSEIMILNIPTSMAGSLVVATMALARPNGRDETVHQSYGSSSVQSQPFVCLILVDSELILVDRSMVWRPCEADLDLGVLNFLVSQPEGQNPQHSSDPQFAVPFWVQTRLSQNQAAAKRSRAETGSSSKNSGDGKKPRDCKNPSASPFVNPKWARLKTRTITLPGVSYFVVMFRCKI